MQTDKEVIIYRQAMDVDKWIDQIVKHAMVGRLAGSRQRADSWQGRR